WVLPLAQVKGLPELRGIAPNFVPTFRGEVFDFAVLKGGPHNLFLFGVHGAHRLEDTPSPLHAHAGSKRGEGAVGSVPPIRRQAPHPPPRPRAKQRLSRR